MTPEEQEDALIAAIVGKVSLFVTELLAEGERAAVVLGAARLEVALEELLKKYFVNGPTGDDGLFEGTAPLATFSAKIKIAYRLGLINLDCRSALDLIRNIRNDFAHASTRITLTESSCKSRVNELTRKAKKGDGFYAEIESKFQGAAISLELRDFCVAIVLCLTLLLHAIEVIKPSVASHVADL